MPTAEVMLYIAIFLFFGIIMGSFLNVVGLRLPQGKSFISNERSECTQCNHTLRWYELIPVVSYLIQGGKCKHCQANISIQYPLIELFTGFLFALAFIKFGLELELIIALLFISMLVVIFVADLKYLIIPNKVLLFFLLLFIIGRIFVPLDPWYSPILAAVIGFIGIMLIILLSKGGMGAGDMKLFFVLGIVLGLGNLILTFVLSCFIGLAVGIVLMIKGVVKKGVPFPFGPSIVVAALIAYFVGDIALDWYMNFL